MKKMIDLGAALLACALSMPVLADSLTIQGNLGEVGVITPAYGTVEVATGETLDLSAEPLVYTNSVRYACSGYVTEVLQADGSWTVEGTNLAQAVTYTADGQDRRLT